MPRSGSDLPWTYRYTGYTVGGTAVIEGHLHLLEEDGQQLSGEWHLRTLGGPAAVGPQVGKDLRQKGLLSILYAMIGILVYVSWRFELRFAVGAIIALLHDVMITLGVFSLTGKEIDLPIIAAFLAIIGYSLNDTIVVYDRIRENYGKHQKLNFQQVVNRSINETLSRTILTSGTTLLVVLALFIFGGGVIPDADARELRNQGVAEIFQPGASLKAISSWLESTLDQRED